MREYGVYHCQWYVIHHEYRNRYPTEELRFWKEIIEIKQYDKIGKMWPVRPLKLNDFLKTRKGYLRFHNEISLIEHRLVGPAQFGITGIKKRKYPKTIEEKQWKAFEK